MPEQSPYASINVPLIQSPSLRVPKQVELPPDIHPLPESVTPYFVYPFTLESHILTLESTRRATLTAHATKRAAYLQHRASEKEQRARQRIEDEERRRREALRKVAPGFEPERGVLVPEERGVALKGKSGAGDGESRGGEAEDGGQGQGQGQGGHQRTRSVMDELVDQLAALDASRSPPPPPAHSPPHHPAHSPPHPPTHSSSLPVPPPPPQPPLPPPPPPPPLGNQF
ncbi:hypothetical protein CC1G_13095 [Coprinopsis cinerea okayama7|uniref:Uncharacterized protein n=1 Tax=Coprinopsis cinerea (strain Okayama-7 / 130 / ATCC MYA-4618 / FGSC 9003) TaxID=240176 RepID=A8P1U2_COPC7|nr:hypothetical protein CC1G_13095 [Coprinopsis cinerea okayama7\|eukprot:XP_001838177.1 hypothetical protein CC1G_13095 [Coprinopsis cinerea okayama7\